MAVNSTFLVCTRAVEKQKFTSEPGETTFLRVAMGSDSYSPANAISAERWRKAVISSADGDEDEVTGTTGDVLLYVHGYNNTAADVLWRTRKLQETLALQGWRGVVIAFDWPSDNSTLNYLEDRSDAAAVSQRLVEEVLPLLIEGQFPDDPDDACTLNLHLLGHSTGAYVIMEAFANAMKQGDFFKKAWRIGQVAFIAGDVASSSLSENSEWAQPMFRRICRLTNYSNGFDKVLAVSNAKRLGTSPRAGRIGVPTDAPRLVVNVDCSEYFLTKDPATSDFIGTFNHAWHIGDENFALDLAMTLEGEIDRDKLPTRETRAGQLELVGGASRPPYQDHWDASSPAEVGS